MIPSREIPASTIHTGVLLLSPVCGGNVLSEEGVVMGVDTSEEEPLSVDPLPIAVSVHFAYTVIFLSSVTEVTF